MGEEIKVMTARIDGLGRIAANAAVAIRAFGRASVLFDVVYENPTASGKKIAYLCRQHRRTQSATRPMRVAS